MQPGASSPPSGASSLHGATKARPLLARVAALSKAGDVEGAFRTATRAAAAGERGAWTTLGNMHAKGLGTPQNKDEAYACYTKAYESGDARGAGLLAMCLITGSGTGSNLDEGLQLLIATARNGDLTAMRNCSWVYKYGEKYGIPKDEEAAKEWLIAAQAAHSRKKSTGRRNTSLPIAMPEDNPSLYSHGSTMDMQYDENYSNSLRFPGRMHGMNPGFASQPQMMRAASGPVMPPHTSQPPLSRTSTGPILHQAYSQPQFMPSGPRHSMPPGHVGGTEADAGNQPQQMGIQQSVKPSSTPVLNTGVGQIPVHARRPPLSPPNAGRPSAAPGIQSGMVSRPTMAELGGTYGSTAAVYSSPLPRPVFGAPGGLGEPPQPSDPLIMVPIDDSLSDGEQANKTREEGVAGEEAADGGAAAYDVESQLSPFRKFLIQCDVRHVGIPLGCTAFTAMWRAISLTYAAAHGVDFAANQPPYFTHIVVYFMTCIWYGLWAFTFTLMTIFLSLYFIRSFHYPYLTVQDFEDPVLTNFFAAIAIVCGVLTVIVPPPIANKMVIDLVFSILLTYKGVLSVGFWYTDWLFSTGTNSLRRTSPIYFMAVINFFILSTISAQVGFVELGVFLFMLGSLFWLIVFVTSFSFIAKTYKQGVDKPSPTLFCFLAPPAAAGIGWITISKARGQDPLNDITRFYAATLFFLLLLLARLADLFCSLSFNVGWWAYVFPLGSAATMTILLSSLFDNNLAMLALSWSAFIATTSLMMIVATLTVRDIARGKIPASPAALKTYARRKRFELARIQEEAASSDGETETGDIEQETEPL